MHIPQMHFSVATIKSLIEGTVKLRKRLMVEKTTKRHLMRNKTAPLAHAPDKTIRTLRSGGEDSKQI